MKTTKIMKRQMGEYEVLQRTSDSYFRADDLLRQWNLSHGGKNRRDMDRFLKSPKTKEFIEALQSEIAISQKREITDIQVIKFGNGGYANSNKKNIVYFHPYLFLKFAMYINSAFEVQVIKFCYDELISLRNDAGDNYTKLMQRVYGFTDCDFGKVAIAMNWVVFNEHCKQRRDWGTVEQMKELRQLECTLCSMIETGLVNSQMELIEVLRKMYDNKYRKF
jgi:hypothetical protein